jgi:hypothetical protein
MNKIKVMNKDYDEKDEEKIIKDED